MIRFVASYPKSGSTWVRLFLMAYEDPDGFDFNHRPLHHRNDTDTKVYGRVSPVEVEKLTQDEVRLLRGAVLVWLSRVAERETKGPCYVKTHSANVVVNGLAWIPPEITERALYILRDPRDVVVSYADHLGEGVDDGIRRLADEQHSIHRDGPVHQPIMSWSLHVGSWLRETPFDKLALRYEDLAADPEKWFREVLKFFGFLFDQARFDAALKLTSFDRLRVEEDKQGFNSRSSKQERFFRQGKAGAWRDVLSEAQVARIEADHGAMMRECGYSTT